MRMTYYTISCILYCIIWKWNVREISQINKKKPKQTKCTWINIQHFAQGSLTGNTVPTTSNSGHKTFFLFKIKVQSNDVIIWIRVTTSRSNLWCKTRETELHNWWKSKVHQFELPRFHWTHECSILFQVPDGHIIHNIVCVLCVVSGPAGSSCSLLFACVCVESTADAVT